MSSRRRSREPAGESPYRPGAGAGAGADSVARDVTAGANDGTGEPGVVDSMGLGARGSMNGIIGSVASPNTDTIARAL